MEGKWALSGWGRDEWSAIRIRELVNLVITCSTSLPRSDITVGSVSFDVGFFVLAFLPIFSPGPRGKREVGLVGTSSGLGLGKWGETGANFKIPACLTLVNCIQVFLST